MSLDAPVVRYVPDFTMKSPQYRQITVRMLLNHSAGFPGSDYADGLTTKPFPGYVDGVLAGLRNSYLKTSPGSMNVYCNDCYTLAGVVLERVSGMSLPDYVAKNIFKPLGMKHLDLSDVPAGTGKVAPVIQGGGVQPFQVPNLFATGALLSTANDMARLAMVFTGGVVDGKRILAFSHRPDGRRPDHHHPRGRTARRIPLRPRLGHGEGPGAGFGRRARLDQRR